MTAYPERPCVAFVGDGGFSMLMAELATCVKYRLPVKVVVTKNNTLGQIKWEQMVFLGNPEYGCELQPIDFAAFARACGATDLSIRTRASAVASSTKRSPRPVPSWSRRASTPSSRRCPRRSPWSRRKFAQSLVRGEPNREKIALTVLADKVRELI